MADHCIITLTALSFPPASSFPAMVMSIPNSLLHQSTWFLSTIITNLCQMFTLTTVFFQPGWPARNTDLHNLMQKKTEESKYNFSEKKYFNKLSAKCLYSKSMHLKKSYPITSWHPWGLGQLRCIKSRRPASGVRTNSRHQNKIGVAAGRHKTPAHHFSYTCPSRFHTTQLHLSATPSHLCN